MSRRNLRPSCYLPERFDQGRRKRQLATRMRQTLAERALDFATLEWLARNLEQPEVKLLAACAQAANLGICDSSAGPLVYCLPPQPVAAGFEVVHLAGHLRLRLPEYGFRPPLLITGLPIGTVPPHLRATTIGAGELAHTIARFTQSASDWLPRRTDAMAAVFGLIAEGWRHATSHSFGGQLVHRTSFREPIASGPTVPGGTTNRLELLTEHLSAGHELVNLYPIPAQDER